MQHVPYSKKYTVILDTRSIKRLETATFQTGIPRNTLLRELVDAFGLTLARQRAKNIKPNFKELLEKIETLETL